MHHGILLTGIEYGVIDLGLQGHLAIRLRISRTAFNVALAYIYICIYICIYIHTDLGRSSGVTRHNVLLFFFRKGNGRSEERIGRSRIEGARSLEFSNRSEIF